MISQINRSAFFWHPDLQSTRRQRLIFFDRTWKISNSLKNFWIPLLRDSRVLKQSEAICFLEEIRSLWPATRANENAQLWITAPFFSFKALMWHDKCDSCVWWSCCHLPESLLSLSHWRDIYIYSFFHAMVLWLLLTCSTHFPLDD